ncbi:MAG: PAS domain S-box protein [Promethearchaeota archaeon]
MPKTKDLNKSIQTDEAIKESKRKFCTLIEMAPDGIVLVDAQGMIVEVNNTYTRVFGYDRDELIGKTFYEFIPCLEGQVKAKEQFLAFNKVDRTSPLQFPAHTKTGEQIPIEMAIAILKDDLGKFKGTINVFRDISEREKAEETFHEIEQKFRLISESSLVGMAIVQENQIKYVNEAITEIFELSKQEMMQWTLIDIQKAIYPDDALFAITQLQKKQTGEKEGITPHYQFRIVTKTNKIKWVKIISNTISYNDKPADFVTLIDITKLKMKEEALKQSNVKLRDFAATVSHDLKAPLRGISYLTEWLAKEYTDKLDVVGNERINMILDQVQRMDILVDDLLKFSIMGQLQEEQISVDLEKLINEIIEFLNPPSHIKIVYTIEFPSIPCRKARITHIMQNLLDNAIKFIDKPMGLIQIGCRDIGAYWEFSITDNGSGIEQKYFDRIFRISQTLASQSKVKGTGVGLSLVKKIIEQDGGKIWLESELGKGTTFYFTIPKSSQTQWGI